MPFEADNVVSAGNGQLSDCIGKGAGIGTVCVTYITVHADVKGMGIAIAGGGADVPLVVRPIQEYPIPIVGLIVERGAVGVLLEGGISGGVDGELHGLAVVAVIGTIGSESESVLVVLLQVGERDGGIVGVPEVVAELYLKSAVMVGKRMPGKSDGRKGTIGHPNVGNAGTGATSPDIRTAPQGIFFTEGTALYIVEAGRPKATQVVFQQPRAVGRGGGVLPESVVLVAVTHKVISSGTISIPHHGGMGTVVPIGVVSRVAASVVGLDVDIVDITLTPATIVIIINSKVICGIGVEVGEVAAIAVPIPIIDIGQRNKCGCVVGITDKTYLETAVKIAISTEFDFNAITHNGDSFGECDKRSWTIED